MPFVLLLASVLFLTGCTSRAFDQVQRALSFVALRNQSSLIVVTNTTTQGQGQCVQSNSVVVRKSFPASGTLYCRDKSVLNSKLVPGPVCPGGVTVAPLSVSDTIRECSQVTVCGMPASAIQSMGGRADGSVEELTFANLPWGCEAKVEFSFDPNFSADSINKLEFYVQPPECPFCTRQNKRTCLPCTDIAGDETVTAGQVIRNCTGPTCAACPTLGLPEVTVPHAQGTVYYTAPQGICGSKCSANSLLRMCNNGLWEGDPSYQFPQCIDMPCGCTLETSTGTISFAHGAVTTAYKTTEPACGVACQDQSIVLSCVDGTWKNTLGQAVPPAELASYRETSCHRKVCNCARPGRATIADGFTNSENYSKSTVSCSETCSAFQGAVTCNAGSLTATNPAFLGYGFDSCVQEDCGCRVPLNGGSSLLLANNGSRKLYRYVENSLEVPDACTNPSYAVNLTCTNRSLTPAYDASVFKYAICVTRDLSCTFTDAGGNKTVVASGSRLTVSVNSAPACGEACSNLELTCQNQVFKKMVGGSPVTVTPAELANYRSGSQCTVKNCDCTVNGSIIPFGQSDPEFYQIDKVTDCNQNGCSAAKATITCGANGPTSSRGDNPNLYKFKSCEFIPCACSVPWGGSIESGKTARVYSIESAACGPTATACEDPANYKTVTCTNAVLSPALPAAFQYPTCKPPVCDCSYGGIRKPFGTKLTVYKVKEPPSGESCASYAAEATCNPGGIWSGALLADYPFASCLDIFTDDGSGGGTGGGTGNDEGPGTGIKRRLGLGDGGGGGKPPICTSFADCKTSVPSVSVQHVPKLPCITPWGGGEVEFYGEIAAFDTKCVVAGTGSCTQHRITRTCHFPAWTGGNEYRYPSCEEKSSCP